MTRSRISMIVAAGALVLVGLLAAALFGPGKDDTATETTAKENQVEKIVAPKTDAATRPVGPIITSNERPAQTQTPDTAQKPTVDPKPDTRVERKPDPKPAPRVIDYVIKPGDMISRLAANNGVSKADIYALNPGLDDATAAKIRAGTTIKLPTGPGATVEETKPAEQPKAAGFAARVVKAKAGQDAAGLAREYYGSLAPMAAIARANADTLGYAFVCKGGEEIILPAWGTQADSRVDNAGSEAPRPVASRGSIIPGRP